MIIRPATPEELEREAQAKLGGQAIVNILKRRAAERGITLREPEIDSDEPFIEDDDASDYEDRS